MHVMYVCMYVWAGGGGKGGGVILYPLVSIGHAEQCRRISFTGMSCCAMYQKNKQTFGRASLRACVPICPYTPPTTTKAFACSRVPGSSLFSQVAMIREDLRAGDLMLSCSTAILRAGLGEKEGKHGSLFCFGMLCFCPLRLTRQTQSPKLEVKGCKRVIR